MRTLPTFSRREGDSKADKKGNNMLDKTEMVVMGHEFVRSNVSVKARASYLARTLDMTRGGAGGTAMLVLSITEDVTVACFDDAESLNNHRVSTDTPRPKPRQRSPDKTECCLYGCDSRRCCSPHSDAESCSLVRAKSKASCFSVNVNLRINSSMTN